MTKAEMSHLERAFVAEIEGRLYQSRSRVVARLAEDGFLEPASRQFGTGPWAVIACGYELTHLGRLTYCMSCDAEAA